MQDPTSDRRRNLRRILSRRLSGTDLTECIQLIEDAMDAFAHRRPRRIVELETKGLVLPPVTLDPDYVESKKLAIRLRNGLSSLVFEFRLLPIKIRRAIGQSAFDAWNRTPPGDGNKSSPKYRALLSELLDVIKELPEPLTISRRSRDGLSLLVRKLPTLPMGGQELVARSAYKAALRASFTNPGMALQAMLEHQLEEINGALHKHAGTGAGTDGMPSTDNELKQEAMLAAIVVAFNRYGIPVAGGSESVLVRVCRMGGISRRRVENNLSMVSRVSSPDFGSGHSKP